MKKALPFFLSLLLTLLFALPAPAAEASRDFIIRALPDYELSQKREYGKLKINTAMPESTKFTETSYTGNLVDSTYLYKSKGDVPSQMYILEYYQAAVEKLGGSILWQDKKNLHASFQRNDKQYYMTVEGWNYDGGKYSVKILEPVKLNFDVEIIDADTILHKLDKEGHIALYINFDTGLATIKPESKEVIDEIVSALKSKPALKVKLEGHTDNVGNAAANKKLSDDRAKAVMDAIIAKGIDKARLTGEGFGLEKPVADNNTEAGRAKNRRVELVKVQ